VTDLTQDRVYPVRVIRRLIAADMVATNNKAQDIEWSGTTNGPLNWAEEENEMDSRYDNQEAFGALGGDF